MELNIEDVEKPADPPSPPRRGSAHVFAASRLLLQTERASRYAEHPELRGVNPAYGVSPTAKSHVFYDSLPNGLRYWTFAPEQPSAGTLTTFRLVARAPKGKRGRLPSLKLPKNPVILHLNGSRRDETISIRILANESRGGPKASRKSSYRVSGLTELDKARLASLLSSQ
jgi:hypothetical protein